MAMVRGAHHLPGDQLNNSGPEAIMRTLQVLLLGSLAGALWHPVPSDAAARRYEASPARIICGQTGCFEVPRGCQGEIRRSGKGVVAVVNCPR